MFAENLGGHSCGGKPGTGGTGSKRTMIHAWGWPANSKKLMIWWLTLDKCQFSMINLEFFDDLTNASSLYLLDFFKIARHQCLLRDTNRSLVHFHQQPHDKQESTVFQSMWANGRDEVARKKSVWDTTHPPFFPLYTDDYFWQTSPTSKSKIRVLTSQKELNSYLLAGGKKSGWNISPHQFHQAT